VKGKHALGGSKILKEGLGDEREFLEACGVGGSQPRAKSRHKKETNRKRRRLSETVGSLKKRKLIARHDQNGEATRKKFGKQRGAMGYKKKRGEAHAQTQERRLEEARSEPETQR